MSFTEDLVFEFPAVAQKMENVITLSKAYLSYFKDLPMKSGMFNKESPIEKTETTLKNMLNKMNEEYAKVSQQHLTNGTNITTNIVKPLEVLIKDLEAGKKETLKNYVINYKKLANEIQNVTAAGSNLEGVALEKNNAKLNQLEAKLTKAETDYRAAVEKANVTREVLYQTEVPEVLKSCNELISKHFDTFKSYLDQFITYTAELSTVVSDVSGELKTCLEEVNFESDLEEFVKANANCHEIPPLEVDLEGQITEPKTTEVKEESKEEEPKAEEPKEEEPKEEEPKEEEPKEEEPKEEEPKAEEPKEEAE
ncbi:F-BAR domain-containing protein [Entamoeba marina]